MKFSWAASGLLALGLLAVAALVAEVLQKRRKLSSWLRVSGRVVEEKETETTSGHSSYSCRISFSDPAGRTLEFWETTGSSRLPLGSQVELIVDPANTAVAERVQSSNAIGGLALLGFFAGLLLLAGLRMLRG